MICLLYLGANTAEYLQFQAVCARILVSFDIKTPPYTDISAGKPEIFSTTEEFFNYHAEGFLGP